jgi:hypothetical protein
MSVCSRATGPEKENARIVSDPGTRVTIARQPPFVVPLDARLLPFKRLAERDFPRTMAIACVQ